MRLVRQQPSDAREAVALLRHNIAVYRARADKARAALRLDALIGDLTDHERNRHRRNLADFTAAAEQLQAHLNRRDGR